MITMSVLFLLHLSILYASVNSIEDILVVRGGESRGSSSGTRLSSSLPIFSRPPAPLFQGNGYDYITLYLSLNQNDAKREDRKSLLYPEENNDTKKNGTGTTNSSNTSFLLPKYELQMEERYRRNHTTSTIQKIKEVGNYNDSYEDSKVDDDDDENVGVWIYCNNVGQVVPSSTDTHHFPTTISIPDLSSEKTYR